ncbi:hypothetical protein OJ997_30065 [Solirubrobacter phytolaccae]|uniref:DUF4352 domain-containing protein n=1 Tax=Solirubrobacter phytolaccae TaxID=1404360 RepID=A0A9X3NJ05_9ACTN|nr:hypothetical protein [Solirubrobacter phytolaccae]MDA0184586.1 hypothetical protein [Solirubrobacter phytolaccae]
MRNRIGVLALAALLAGCGSDNKTDEPTPSATAAAEQAAGGHDLDGYSEGVKKFYGEPHAHEGEGGDVEAEYHQPPLPPETALGGPITLTGSNIGVRLVMKPTELSREGDFTVVEFEAENTGIANFEGAFRNAEITYDDGETKPVATREKADCSNGWDAEYLRIDTSAKVEGCLLFPRSGDASPERLQLALEDVPTEAGGIWDLR